MTRRLADLLSGLALLALSGWMYSCAVDIDSYRRTFRPVTLAVEPSPLARIEWAHSAGYWFALASMTLLLGLAALVLAARARRAPPMA